MEYITLAFSIVSSILSTVVLIILLKNKKTGDVSLGDAELKKIRNSVNESVESLSNTVSLLVAEKNSTLMENVNKKVDDLNKKIDELIKSENDLKNNHSSFKEETIKLLNDNNKTTNKLITDFIKQYTEDNNKQKEEIMTKISSIMKEFNETVKERFEEFKKNTNESIKQLTDTVSKNLTDIRKDNNEKLDKINESVNEKLQKTLEEKLKDSFKSVVEGIGDVNKAVGEIKGLATDVGSLKNQHP